MAEINKLNIKGVNYDIKAKYDEDGNEIDATYLKKKDNFAYGINTFTVENGKLTKMTIKSRDDGAIESVDVGADTSNLVDLISTQSISGVKTFTNEVKTNQIANVNDNAMVRFKETEGKNVFGGISYDCVLMGKSERPFYSKDGSDFSGSELALLKDKTQVMGMAFANAYGGVNVIDESKEVRKVEICPEYMRVTAKKSEGYRSWSIIAQDDDGYGGCGIHFYPMSESGATTTRINNGIDISTYSNSSDPSEIRLTAYSDNFKYKNILSLTDTSLTYNGKAIVTEDMIEAKQDKLTAGDGVTINNNVISASGGSSGGIKLYKHNVYDNIIVISLSPTPLTDNNPSSIQNGNCISVNIVDGTNYYASGLISYTSDQPWYVVHYYGGKNGTTYKAITFNITSDTVTEL